MYVFAGTQKLLANNLKSVIGSFSEPILVASADGSRAVGAKTIFNGTLFTQIKVLPLAPTVVALGADDTHAVPLRDHVQSHLPLQDVDMNHCEGLMIASKDPDGWCWSLISLLGAAGLGAAGCGEVVRPEQRWPVRDGQGRIDGAVADAVVTTDPATDSS